MERKSQRNGALEAATSRLAARWSGRDPFELANRATAQLMDSASDWNPPTDIEPRPNPVRLGVGIPDAYTMPREELLEALQRAMAAPRDRPLRYHFGPGFEPLRELLAERYTRDRGLPVDLNWFQLANGSSGAIDMICRTTIDPGDVIISEEGAVRAARLLEEQGHRAVVLPPVAYAVTDYASEFAGTITIRPQTARALLLDVIVGAVRTGFAGVVLCNAHLEPGNL